MVRVCGRPSNAVQETASFDIDANHWISFPNKKTLFPWTGTYPEAWSHKPMPNTNNPKFMSVSGILAGMRTVGGVRRYHVDITLPTFLGPAPPAYVTQSEYPMSRPITQADSPHSINLNPQGEAKGRNQFRRQTHPDQEVSHLNYHYRGQIPYFGTILTFRSYLCLFRSISFVISQNISD